MSEVSEVSKVRCKFACISVTKRKNWSSTDQGTQPFIYEAEFQVVYGGSEENEKFFASTPTGTLKIGTMRDDLFEPGREYYLDFTPAPG